MSRLALPAAALAATLALVHWYGDSVRPKDLWFLPDPGAAPAPSAGGPAASGGAVEIPSYMVLVGALGPISTVFVSRALGLGLGTDLLLGTVRVAVQLTALGTILGPVFRIDRVPLSVAYMFFMLSVAAVEAASRPTQSYRGATRDAAISLLLPASVVLTFGIGVVVRPTPFLWSAQYLIPVAGMLLGNSCTAVAMSMSSTLNELAGSKDVIEANLAAGASRSEASRHIIQKACRVGISPSINQMNVAGIVAIPGLMTGQILGGADPMRAARYQIVLLFFIVATSGAASALSAIFVARTILDGDSRLRLDRLETRQYEKGVAGFVEYLAETVWRALFGRKRAVASAGQDGVAAGPAGEALRAPLLDASRDSEIVDAVGRGPLLDAVERGLAPPLRRKGEAARGGSEVGKDDDGAVVVGHEAGAEALADGARETGDALAADASASAEKASASAAGGAEKATEASASAAGGAEKATEASAPAAGGAEKATEASAPAASGAEKATEASAPAATEPLASSSAGESPAPLPATTPAAETRPGSVAATQPKPKRSKGKRPKGRR